MFFLLETQKSLIESLPFDPFNSFLGRLGLGAIAVFTLYFILFNVLPIVFRQFTKDLALVSLYVTRIPLLVGVTAGGLIWSLAILESTDYLVWVNRGLTALIIIAATQAIARMFTEVIVYYLKDFADKSEAMWDDVLVPLIESALPIIIYLIGGFLVLQSIGIDLTGLWVAFGGITFVLGFALQGILSNFFGGLVLLVDTPFRFGDVISLPDGSRAVIRKIGIRVTNLYLIDTHCEMYIPNGTLEKQQIINLSRPTSHYYYTIKIPIKADVDPARAVSVMEKVVLAHPDTLGTIDRKLQVIDKLYGFSGTGDRENKKREVGRERLLAEKEVNDKLAKVEESLNILSENISEMEQGGLDAEEKRRLQSVYLEICELVGLEARAKRMGKRKQSWLEEVKGAEDNLISLIRGWYRSWLKDPDLMKEDQRILPHEWEQKIDLLSLKMNKLYRKILEPGGEETRLDDYVASLTDWLRDSFKSSRNEWQEPKIWVDEVKGDYSRDTTVKFYVDDIKLEHCERGSRVTSEVRREIIWHLRQAYLCQ